MITTYVPDFEINYLTQAQYDEALANDQINDLALYCVKSDVPYISESGTDGIWTYRKWSDGTAECWGRASVSLTSYTTVNSFSGYYTDFALPSGLFTSITTHEYTVTIGSGFAIAAGGMSTDTTSYRVYALATATGTQTCTFEMTAKGRWK